MDEDAAKTDVTSDPSARITVPVAAAPKRKVAELKRASKELEKFDPDNPGQILELAGQMDLLPSSTLAGFLGGAVGTVGGVAFGGIVIAGFALPAVVITGPLGMVVGIAVALITWRGPEQWRIEKKSANFRQISAEIDKRITQSLR